MAFGPIMGGITLELMSTIAHHHRNLCALELHSASEHDPDAFQPLQGLSGLTSLKLPLSDDKAVQDVANCQHLQQVWLTCHSTVSVPGLARLVALGPQLQKLTVSASSTDHNWLEYKATQVSVRVMPLGWAVRHSVTPAVAADS